MNNRRLDAQRLVVLFGVGCLLFNYPLLTIFSSDGMVWGIPVLYVYIFIAWAVLIGMMAIVVRR